VKNVENPLANRNFHLGGPQKSKLSICAERSATHSWQSRVKLMRDTVPDAAKKALANAAGVSERICE
jgi:hypothetical protein